MGVHILNTWGNFLKEHINTDVIFVIVQTFGLNDYPIGIIQYNFEL